MGGVYSIERGFCIEDNRLIFRIVKALHPVSPDAHLSAHTNCRADHRNSALTLSFLLPSFCKASWYHVSFAESVQTQIP